ncbi:RNA polymerase sigma-70 factor [Solitalea sp. MAHUQ-68]|uniref:RNA polymerase sigma-70 factor n=1 Tax=Solitalea agri TaxID=2953739 RepID=A0A9X2F0K2_9SPHI|nr:RNA polymerase sigma-70 factor [Solitalea agri]MCO4291885.1 RNA polymerase sigma-70 factor [Solitalea agri]
MGELYANVEISLEQFEQLFHKNYEKLCLTALQYVKDRDLAEDLVQEFYIYVWNKRQQIVLQSSFEAYALKAVKNICITFLKRRKNHISYQSDELPEMSFDPEQLISLELSKSAAVSKLMAAIKELPPERRKLFLMSNLLGYTYSEIALKNNISINTVKTQIKKAYVTLRINLSDISTVGLLFFFGLRGLQSLISFF